MIVTEYLHQKFSGDKAFQDQFLDQLDSSYYIMSNLLNIQYFMLLSYNYKIIVVVLFLCQHILTAHISWRITADLSFVKRRDREETCDKEKASRGESANTSGSWSSHSAQDSLRKRNCSGRKVFSLCNKNVNSFLKPYISTPNTLKSHMTRDSELSGKEHLLGKQVGLTLNPEYPHKSQSWVHICKANEECGDKGITGPHRLS